jgi:hypothetical protein
MRIRLNPGSPEPFRMLYTVKVWGTDEGHEYYDRSVNLGPSRHCVLI